MKPQDNYKILARLAEADINIFSAHREGDDLVIEYEYGWKPNEYKTKWTKAIYIMPASATLADALEHVLREVESIRAELN